MPIYVLFNELVNSLLANMKDATNPDNRVVPLENICRLDGASTLCIRVYIPRKYQQPDRAQRRSSHQWHTVISSEAPRICPPFTGFQAKPNLPVISLRYISSNQTTHPSFVCPTNLISGLQTPPLGGSLECFVRSKMSTCPEIAFVASKSGFCGIYRARLTSPS